MRKFNYLSAVVISMMMFFTSCSKDDPSVIEEEIGKTATLSFGTVLNDLVSSKAALKQVVTELPECSDDAPATVEVILSMGGTNVVGDAGSPVSIPINPTPYDYDNDGDDEYFTNESSDLELEPGDYVLEYFQVLDGDGDLIWAAPIDTGSPSDFSGLVDFPLPMDISLGAGVKKYVPIEVVCYDDRFVNEYGYLFFDIENSEAIEFCLFGNVCDENGRHAPANFRFDVWVYSGDAANPHGTALFDANNPYENTVGVNNDGDAYGEPLCLFLPDTAGEDVYYGELYLIENGTSTLIREGQFTDADVTGLFDGDDNTDYYHFREGCGGGEDFPNLFPGDTEEPTIDQDTEIYIYFDSSGSMNSTLSPLVEMRNTLLKDALIGLYNNDDALYDDRVQVISDGSERTMHFLNLRGETPGGNAIALVFQDESVTSYTSSSSSWDSNTPRTGTYETDITTLRGRLATWPANYYHGIIFQVETPGYPGAEQFADLITYVENGTGNYAGAYGLSDRTEFGYEYNVTPGASPEYYKDLIVAALQGLGYNL